MSKRTPLPENVRLRRVDDGEMSVLEDGSEIGRVFRAPLPNQDGTMSVRDHWAWKLHSTGEMDGGAASGRQAASDMLRLREMRREWQARENARRANNPAKL